MTPLKKPAGDIGNKILTIKHIYLGIRYLVSGADIIVSKHNLFVCSLLIYQQVQQVRDIWCN